MKKNIIYFEPYVFANPKKNETLIYNSLSGQTLTYNSIEISTIVKSMLSKKSVFMYKYTPLKMSINLQKFITDIRNGFFGDTLDISGSEKPPFPLITNILDHPTKKVHDNEEYSYDSESIENLNEIFLYLNNKQNLFKKELINIYKQTTWCFNDFSGEYKEMDKNYVFHLLKSLNKTSTIENVHFLGGDLFSISYYNELCLLLSELGYKKTIYFSIESILNIDKYVRLLEVFIKIPNTTVVLLVDTNIDNIPSALRKYIDQHNLLLKFIIQDEADLNKYENFIDTYQIQDYMIASIYTGNNLSFFKDNVFFSKNELLSMHPKFKEINLKKSINMKNFGKFYILPNLDIYSNLNMPKLGNIKNVPIYNFITKELEQGSIWKKTRMAVKPCNDCIYNFLCPSISDFEYYMNNHKICVD